MGRERRLFEENKIWRFILNRCVWINIHTLYTGWDSVVRLFNCTRWVAWLISPCLHSSSSISDNWLTRSAILIKQIATFSTSWKWTWEYMSTGQNKYWKTESRNTWDRRSSGRFMPAYPHIVEDCIISEQPPWMVKNFLMAVSCICSPQLKVQLSDKDQKNNKLMFMLPHQSKMQIEPK
jgi:hypothetical protein